MATTNVMASAQDEALLRAGRLAVDIHLDVLGPVEVAAWQAANGITPDGRGPTSLADLYNQKRRGTV